MSFKGVYSIQRDLMSDGSDLQVCAAATENTRPASSFRVLGTGLVFFAPTCLFALCHISLVLRDKGWYKYY